MRFDSVLCLIEEAFQSFSDWSNTPGTLSAATIRAPMVSFGVGCGDNPDSYKLAVRARTTFGLDLPPVQDIIQKSKNESDIRVVGLMRGPRRIVNFKIDTAQEMKQRVRPLQSGHSVGHHAITAGTLGTFVKGKQGIMMLSNNHVLANSNQAKIGDAILQPGSYDGGKNPADICGKLVAFKEMKKEHNLMDVAVASIEKDAMPKDFALPHIGKVGKKVISPEDILGKQVQKIGRTTGHTKGKVSAIKLRNVAVNYRTAIYSFDDLIEVMDPTGGDFSAGGDSGSFVVDMDRNPVGLLFAGGGGHTLLCEIAPILKEFKIELL